MLQKKVTRAVAVLLALVCMLGLLPFSALAASSSSDPPSYIKQENAVGVRINNQLFKYLTANDTVNTGGAATVFEATMSSPELDQEVRALCTYHEGTLSSQANGQCWDYDQEITNPSLNAILTWVYTNAYGDCTEAGNAVGAKKTWDEGWTNLWFITAQGLTWYYEYGELIDYNTNRDAFIQQIAEELLCAFRVCYKVYGWVTWADDKYMDNATIYSIIDSGDNGVTGASAYDFAKAAMDLVLDHPEYYHTYRLWQYKWRESQNWALNYGQKGDMQTLLIAIPDSEDEEESFSLTVKKLEAGTNQPLAGVTFKIESTADPATFSITRTTGADGTITLTKEADGLFEGQYTITELAAPSGYLQQSGSQTVTVLSNSSAENVFTFYNTPTTGSGNIRKVDADNPTVGLPGAVIKITSIELDNGGSFSGTYITGDGGYISSDDLDFTNLPTGSYLAEEITPPQGYTLSSDTVKVRQTFVWDAVHDVSLVFEDDSKVKVKLIKQDESGNPLAGAVFVVLKDGQLIETKTTDAAGTITVSNVSEGYYEFREVVAPAGYDKDSTPVGVYVNAEDLQGEQTITVTKTNYHKRGLTIEKRDAETGDTIPGTVFHVRGVNVAFEQDVTTEANGKVTLSSLPSGCYEITETSVPSPWLLDTNNRRTVWIDAKHGTDATVIFKNSTKPGLRIVKTDYETGQPIEGVTFKIERVSGGYSAQHKTDSNGEIFLDNLTPGAYTVTEVQPAPGYVADDTPHIVNLEENRTTTLELVNIKQPTLKIIKTDAVTGDPVQGVTFTIKVADGRTITTEATNAQGEIILENLDPGVVEIWEQSVPDNYILNTEHQLITLVSGKLATVQFQNYPKPTLKIAKVDIDGKPLTGAIFTVTTKAGVKIGDFPVGADGTVTIPNTQLDEGYYIITEKQAPTGYILDTTPHEVYLRPGKTTEITIENEKKPGLTIRKIDSVVGDGVKGAKFEIWVSKDKNQNGTYQQLTSSYYYTDANGLIELENLDTGWYKIIEVEPPSGYMLANPSEQIIYVEHDASVEVTFENIPKSALIIRKVDADTGAPLANAWFRVRYLGGTSGTGGTVIGEYQTSSNGNIIITGLDAGTYICEEINAPQGYVIDTAPQTVYISGNDQDCITVTFTNSKYGSLLIKKVDSVTGEPLSDVQFYVTDSSGSVIGNSNGYFTTDSAGTILISDIEPGTTLVVKETRTKDGYVLDETPQTIKITSNETKTLEFRNQPTGTLLIRKVCAVNPSVTLQNAEFKVTYADGTLTGDSGGVYRSDENGEVRIEGLTPGKSVVVTETRAPDGFIIDTQSQTIQIQAGKTVSLTFKNQPKGGIIVQKRDSITGQPLAGAEFRVTTAAGCEVGLDGVIGSSTLTQNGIFTTDSNGEIHISNLAPGAYVLTEIKAPAGYVMDAPSTNVVIGANGDTQTVIITNTPKGNLVVEKYDSVTKQPLSGAQFKITTASGELVADNEGLTSSNGLYVTDENGQIVLSKLLPNTYIVTETKAPDNYQIDPTPQTVVVNAADTQTLRFYDDPLCTLTILKRDAVTKKPLANAEFTVKDSEGRDIGKYITGTDGTVTVTGLTPNGTYVVSESKAPTGYILDETPKNIVVRSGVTNNLTFDDEPATTLIIHKYIEGTENEPLSGVAFKVVDGSGAAVGPDDGVYYTDKAGEIVLEGLEPGTTVIAREIKTVDGYVLDGTPQDILIKAGEVQQLTFWNKKAGTLVIQKKDSVSGALISGAQFQLTYANGGYVDNDNGHLSSNGLYTTDANGEIRISGVTGTIVAKEVKAAPGYVIDQSTQTQTVTVNPLDTQTLTFLNEPLCSLTITKLDSVTGKPVPGTVFVVKDGNGNVLGSYTTGADGTVTVTGLVPGSTVVVSESKVPSGYVLDTTPQTIIVQNGANSLTSGVAGSSGTSTGTGSGNNGLTFENDPTTTLVIEKYVTGTTTPLKGVTFLVTDSSGAVVGSSNGEYITDENGRIVIEGLEPGVTITAKEIRTVEGYILDSTPKSIKIKTGEAQTLRFYNSPQGTLVIRKLDSVTKQPLAGVEFQLTYANGGYVDNANGHLSSNGLYTTDANGEIRISGITGTIVVKETQTIDGYTIDPATQTQTVTVNSADTQTLTFYNAPKQTLTIQKYVDGTTDPIQGVIFLVTDSSGSFVGPNNGEYITDKNGRIVIAGLTPGTTITAKETKTVSGYVLDTTPQSILIKSGEAQTLTFFNKTEGGLELIKVNEADKTQRIPNTTFEIRRMDGGLVDTVTTDSSGRVSISLDAGNYYAVEIEAAEGFKLNNTPHYFTVQDGKTTTLTVTNKALSGILIHKTDSITGQGIYGVSFLLYDSTNTPIGQYTSDNSGYVYIEGLTTSGRYYLRELANDGYIVDTQMKTVYVTAGEMTLVEWTNTPITGQIQITKKSADYNSINGLPAGTLLEGAIFEIYDKAGNLVDTIRSDSRGLAVSKQLPLDRYTIREVKAPDNYGISGEDLTAYLDYAGQIVRFEVLNKSLTTGVSITKTGPNEIMAGQPVNYVFSDIANRSNVRLDNFYWRDTIPAEVRLNTIVTGTYNFPGTYKIVYRVNGGEYRTLADSLSTSKNYTLAASATALGLASNERVTEIMFVFGQAPAGFAQVEKPYLYCTAVASIAASSFVNVADVGGVYNGQWVQAITRWVTKVYKPVVITLPRTGY